MDAPAGTDPVADSATDTLQYLTSGTGITITGNSGADSLDFTLDSGLQDVAGLTPTNNHAIIGDGANWQQVNTTNWDKDNTDDMSNALTSANIFVGNGSNIATGVAMTGDVAIDNTGATTVTDLTMTGEAQGDVLYFNGSNWVKLAAGTSGQFLQTQGAGANPQWAAAAGSGDITDVGDIASGAAFTATAGNDGNSLWFEGTSSDGNEIQLTGADPGADVTVTIPATTGTLLINTDIGTSVQAHDAYLDDIAAVTAAQGDVLYFDGTDWVNLSPGTNGQVLQTQGAGADPQWATVGGSSYWSRTGTNLSPTTAGDDLLLNAGETLSISDLTQGSIIFTGASGLISQDNASLYWDDTNNRLGVGTTTVSYPLEVNGAIRTGQNGTDGQLRIYSEQGATDYEIIMQPNAAMTQDTTYTLPADDGTASQVLTTDGNGALSWTTPAGGGYTASYGELYEDNDTGSGITITTAGTYYQWVTTTVGETSGAGYVVGSAATDNLTIGVNGGGKYLMNYSVSFENTNNRTTIFTIAINGTTQAASKSESISDGDAENFSGTGIYTLANGDTVDLRATSNNNGDVVTIYRANLSITRIE